MSENKKTPDIVIRNTFVNADKESIKTALNKKIEKILQNTGK